MELNAYTEFQAVCSVSFYISILYLLQVDVGRFTHFIFQTKDNFC